MRVFLQIGYFVVGVVQFFAVWDGTEFFLGVDSWIGGIFAFLVAVFLTYIPLIGSGIGVYGAVSVWDWTIGKSLLLFFWYVPMVLIFVGYSYISDRK